MILHSGAAAWAFIGLQFRSKLLTTALPANEQVSSFSVSMPSSVGILGDQPASSQFSDPAQGIFSKVMYCPDHFLEGGDEVKLLQGYIHLANILHLFVLLDKTVVQEYTVLEKIE